MYTAVMFWLKCLVSAARSVAQIHIISHQTLLYCNMVPYKTFWIWLWQFEEAVIYIAEKVSYLTLIVIIMSYNGVTGRTF